MAISRSRLAVLERKARHTAPDDLVERLEAARRAVEQAAVASEGQLREWAYDSTKPPVLRHTALRRLSDPRAVSELCSIYQANIDDYLERAASAATRRDRVMYERMARGLGRIKERLV